MKRSKINERIRDAIAFFESHRFVLPRFANWTPEEWRRRRGEIGELIDRGLGWDVTDFGQGRFDQVGLLLFTMRNGRPEDLAAGTGKVYAEKAMIVGVDQRTPMHHHTSKTEDIIVRGGGTLRVQVYGVDVEDELSADDVCIFLDGISRTVPAGDVIALGPGESVTLTPEIYHSFWAEGDRVLAGEVSTVNDDEADNTFHEAVGRFPEIDEDEAPLRLLVGDYVRLLRDP